MYFGSFYVHLECTWIIIQSEFHSVLFVVFYVVNSVL